MKIDPSDVDGCVARLKVLAEPTRLAVVELLMTEPMHVGQMGERLSVDQSLLSHHLRVLRDAGLVHGDREGRSVRYRLAPSVLGGHGRGLDLGCCTLSFETSGVAR